MSTQSDDHAAILNLNGLFAEAVDHDPTLDRVISLFTRDGTWVMGSKEFEGHEEIRQALQGTRDRGFAGPAAGTRHIVTSQQIYLTADRVAGRGSSQWLLVQPATAPETPTLRGVGRYLDEYVKVDGTWFIQSRSAVS
ncbi:nuclear transport factor 2 family protein [Micromonospora sp. NPDC005206]|uniref:nuclear transport factor 2 family protein n=1 Tax=Micromonospora sp. NPDC005206 TaxID=3157022 RepID=UPI0033A46CED